MFRTYVHAALGVLLVTLVGDACAAITALNPYWGTVVNAGQQFTADWDIDLTGTWTSMTITLMTGDNLNMAPMLELASGIDATVATSHILTAPDVTPNSAIYFLQFTQAGQYPQWTSRFTILDSNGDAATIPEHSNQPEGDAIPWGLGQLVGGPAPTPTLDVASSSSSSTFSTSSSSSLSSSTYNTAFSSSSSSSATTDALSSASLTLNIGSSASFNTLSSSSSVITPSASLTAPEASFTKSQSYTTAATVTSDTTSAGPCSTSCKVTTSCQYVTFTGSSGGVGLSMECSSQTVAAPCSATPTITATNSDVPSDWNGTLGINSTYGTNSTSKTDSHTTATSTRGVQQASSASRSVLGMSTWVVPAAVLPAVLLLM